MKSKKYMLTFSIYFFIVEIMMKLVLKIVFIFFMLSICSFSNAQDKKYFYSNDIRLKVIDNNLNNLKININWIWLPKEARKNFEYYKISHSTTNPDIKYPDNYIWYSDKIINTSAIDNFNEYNPDYKWINYFRVCIVTFDTYYCSKNSLKVDLTQKQDVNYQRNITLKSQTTNNSSMWWIDVSSWWSNAKIQVEINDAERNLAILSFKYFLVFLAILFWFVILYKFITKYNFSSKNSSKTAKENILQILKNENDYIIEYNWIYHKWVKILDNNIKSVVSNIYNYVNSVSKLKSRWVSNLFEELNKIEIKIPDLKESWNIIYRLYIPENIKESLENQLWVLTIKTNEQFIPWETMHDNNNFLSLKFPITRKIMTREKIRVNQKTKNKKPNILFITNPTCDLDWTINETNNIIEKISSKANITVIWEKNAKCSKILSLLSQNNWDIIHYSWHTYFDEKSSDLSWMVLSDGVITANEIKRVLNGNPLIFLNSCFWWKTFDSDYEKYWEDASWLSSSFLIGWAKWVVSSLWQVTDEVWAKFAGEFYENLLKNETIETSILKAKKEIYINYPKDITWASFVYFWEANLTINLN